MSHESPIQGPPSPPLGALLQTLKEADLIAADQTESASGKLAEIVDCKYITSLNWLDRDEPTILVPGRTFPVLLTQRLYTDTSDATGAPPAWTPLEEPRKLEQDQGDYLRDPNAARSPKHPLEPAVRALLIENKDLETQKINLVACSSTLGNLLRFVHQDDRAFRFFVEAIGNTVFFTRHENSPTQLIEGVRGYGHAFPEAYTTWDAEVKGSASHQRLLRYEFAGLDCVLRFECDGYLRSKVPGGGDLPGTASDSQEVESENDLASILDRAKVSSSLAGGDTHKRPLQIRRSDQKIPQEAVFDLKTRSAWRKDLTVLDDELPRYWVAQIPNFILARHRGGVFDDIQVQGIREDVAKWQAAHQTSLRRLGGLLRAIIAAAKGREDGKLEVCCKGPDALELREQDTDGHDTLPAELKQRWIEDNAGERTQLGSDDKLTWGRADSAALTADCDDGRNVGFSDDGRYAGFSDDGRDAGFESDEESEKDYTACSSDSCGYCGHCSY